MKKLDSILKYEDINLLTPSYLHQYLIGSTYDTVIRLRYKCQKLSIMLKLEMSKIKTLKTCLFYPSFFTITGRKFSNADLFAKGFHVSPCGC